MTLALTGHAVGRGIAIGQSHLAERNELQIGEFRIAEGEVDREIQRYRDAVDAARRQLEKITGTMDQNVGIGAGEIIETHVMMLSDYQFRDDTEKRIRDQLCNAEWALQMQLEEVLSEFRAIDDEYIRSRGEDVAQVVRLVQGKLNEEGAGKPFDNMPDRLAHTLVVAIDLTPGELASLHERGVAGIVTEHGGPHSHTAILASSLGIPAVMGVRRAQSLLQEGETLVLDGGLGIVYADPDEAIRSHYHRVQRATSRFKRSLEAIRDLPAVSLDGQSIALLANAERPAELELARDQGADGIGLYRTEFLYLQEAPPNEEAQLAEYAAAIELLDGLPLTIRTLDLGADKPGRAPGFETMRRSANPALGLRAVRLCLRDTDLFKVQLRAILRASALGPVRCLVPMITSVQEVRMVSVLLDEAREELRECRQPFDPELSLGGMIEVPAAAMAMAELGRHLDFFSVGTNDLLQYMLAADRIDEEVAHLYDLQHPGVVRLLRHIFREADALHLPVTVCGEFAGDRRYTRLLLALGLREFSMHPGRLLEVKQVVRETDIPRAKAALTRWFNALAGEDGKSLLESIDNSQRDRASR